MIAALFLPDDATLEDCLLAAEERGMVLISDGRRALVSPVVPAGYFRIRAKARVRSQDYATVEVQRCAA